MQQDSLPRTSARPTGRQVIKATYVEQMIGQMIAINTSLIETRQADLAPKKVRCANGL